MQSAMVIAKPKGSKTRNSPGQQAPGPWAAFHHKTFTVIWIASLVANIGTWTYSASSSWLMTSLNADPLVVSLVQVATSLPMFLFAMPGGAITDMVDRRRLLIFGESATTIASTMFAVLVWLHLVTPITLLLFMFVIGVCGALTSPAWQAIVPQLVPPADLSPAIAANSVGFNISRAVGPALAGVVIGAFGMVAPFWLNAVSNLATVTALLWWRPPSRQVDSLPAERLVSAIRTGIRHARHNRHLRATLVRAIGFFVFASAYWALLPLIARNQIAGGPRLYGFLLGAIGAGAVSGAFVMPWLKAKIGADGMVRAGTLGTAMTLVLYGMARGPAVALTASVIAGVSWICVLASLNVSAQVALPDWVRGRGLAIFGAAMFGAMTLGSVLWGEVAGIAGLPATHFMAAAGALLVIPLTWRYKLQTGSGNDLTPSMHWAMPIVTNAVENDQGPVLVTVKYNLAPAQDRNAFLALLQRLGHQRGRSGAYAWGIFEDAAEPGTFLETFLTESWLEHLRQHQRVTKADRSLQAQIEPLLVRPPEVRHLLTAEPTRITAVPSAL
jgi:MFS family permease